MSKNLVKLLLLSMIVYTILSFFSLTEFPFVHSDETWLSSLSNEMLESGTFKTTEPSFDLYPRNPHAIKIIFNLFQMAFIKLFGHNIVSMRSLSLVFALAAASLFSWLVHTRTRSSLLTITVFGCLLCNIQFIYMSHFARQEALLFFALMLNLLYILGRKSPSPLVSGIISGLAIGIHPNSFIIFMPILVFWLWKRKWRELILYGVTVSAFAALFVSLSFALDPHFITNYLSYGDTLGVNATLWEKVLMIKNFYLKLYYGVSVTYYTPDIRILFYLGGVAILATAVQSFRKRINPLPLLMLLGVNLGYILIGRYNQTSIIFSLPFLLLMAADLLILFKGRQRLVLGLTLVLLTAFNAGLNLTAHPDSESYSEYLSQIRVYVPDGSAVLGNLNTVMAFEDAKVYDYRNLDFLESSIVDYIQERNIEYILYPEEMDFIYQNRPLWNSLYGNLYPYYDDLQGFLSDRCQIIGEFESPIYAMRIVRYIEQQPYTLKIYQVK